MTQDQAAQLLQQNAQILQMLNQFAPFLNSLLHDVFPLFAVVSAAALGGLLAVAATR